MRRAPEPTEASVSIANGPISAVEPTCVPPQSSIDQPSMSTTRTMSPYFSVKSICAPSLRASSIGVSKIRTGRFANTRSFTRRSISVALVGAQRLRMREVEAQLVGPHGRARLLDMVAEHLAQALVEHMRRRVVRHRRVADAPRDDSLHAIALREAFAAEDELLVGLEPQRLHELGARAAVLLLEVARVGDLAAARGIERRLLELRLEEAVAEIERTR